MMGVMVGVLVGFVAGATTVALAQPARTIAPVADSGLVRSELPNQMGRWRVRNCPSCRDVDVPAGSAADVALKELQRKLEASDGALQARNGHLRKLNSELWAVASLVAVGNGTTYQDPPEAKTLEDQIDGRLGFICVSYGLTAECK
ncbi:Hypothetical protein A7982_04976 [Minicystis rosea]|nr:Hypothetical protein A7982_04976 [Minicystis rosea]